MQGFPGLWIQQLAMVKLSSLEEQDINIANGRG